LRKYFDTTSIFKIYLTKLSFVLNNDMPSASGIVTVSHVFKFSYYYILKIWLQALPSCSNKHKNSYRLLQA